MTVTVITGATGGEGMYLARLLAAHATTSPSCLLHPEAENVPFLPPPHVTVMPIEGIGPGYDAAVMRTLSTMDKATSAFIELPPGHPCSMDMAAVSDIILVPMAPGQVSVAEGLRTLAAIEMARDALPEGLTTRQWVFGWDSVGGPAAEDRLIAAAKRAIGRNPDLEIDIKEHLLPWGLPPLHWSELDYLLGLAERPANSRIDDLMKVLHGLVMILRAEPFENLQHFLSEGLADLRNGEPHGEGTRMSLLSHDLHLINAGLAPSQADLHHAPQLSSWREELVPASVLRGSPRGHPTLRHSKSICTSPIVAVDPHHMWVRTLSRFYALGHPDPNGPDLETVRLFLQLGEPGRGKPH